MVEVVAALIWDNDKFMICQRPENKSRALLWEFVEGKVEYGETKEEALVRECKEELDITLSVVDVFMDVIHEYPDIDVHLTLFNAKIIEGKPKPLEHNDLKWILPSEISNYNFCPADEEILKNLKIIGIKMKTLREAYIEISKKSDRWSYYQNPGINIVDTLNDGSGKSGLDFIEKYFLIGGKNKVFADEYIKKNKIFIRERANHIISTFLLGIIIAESFNIDIHKRIDGFDFKYYWFITCLYHDIGYAYAKSANLKYIDVVSENGLDGLKNICKIKNLDKYVFKSVNLEQVDIYLKGRATNHHVLDHGVVGGLLLYDKLMEQYKEAWGNRINHEDKYDNFYIISPYDRRKLHFSNKHFDVYKIVSDAVMRHNIFNSTLSEFIKESNLNAISPIDKKISFNNLFCYILSITDSIEPAKRRLEYLDKIFIKTICDNTGIVLKTEKIVFESIYCNIKALKTWVDVNVNVWTCK